MTENKNQEIFRTQDEYTAGFADEDTSVFNTGRGISREVVETISRIKGEPDWVLEYRLKAFEAFEKMAVQDWGPDLSDLNFDDYIYYIRPADRKSSSWEDVPETIKNTFDKLGIPESEKKFLAGVTTQYESEAVYHNMLEEVVEKGVIFLDIDSALREYPELFRKYFATIVPPSDNKLAASRMHQVVRAMRKGSA